MTRRRRANARVEARITITMQSDRPIPRDWRDRMPAPFTYYGPRVKKLGTPNHDGWAAGRCPFHADHQASLSVNLQHSKGAWRCFAGCGSGDLVAFHMRLTGLGFRQAVRDLLGRP